MKKQAEIYNKQTAIQIQHLLKLNIRKIHQKLWFRLIQIQHLLKLNIKWHK